jgi:hypothetical protein
MSKQLRQQVVEEAIKKWAGLVIDPLKEVSTACSFCDYYGDTRTMCDSCPIRMTVCSALGANLYRKWENAQNLQNRDKARWAALKILVQIVKISDSWVKKGS